MASADDLLSVIDDIYAAPLAADGWSGALRSISDLFGATGATYSGVRAGADVNVGAGAGALEPAFLHQDGTDAAAIKAYNEYYFHICKRGSYSRRESVGSVYYDYKYLSEQAISRDEYYDFLARNDGKYAVGAVLGAPRPNAPRAYQQCAVHFSARRGHPDKSEVALFAKLTPHLVRANRLHKRLEEDRAAALGAQLTLDQSTQALIGLDGDGNIVFINKEAESVLARDDGVSAAARRLTFASACARRRFDAARRGLTTGDGLLRDGATSIVAAERPSGDRPYVLFLAPMDGAPTIWRDAGGARLLVVISDMAAPPPASARDLAQIFGLTQAEAALTLALAGGLTLKAHCEAQGLSVDTGRWHLGNVFSKTGVNRQAALIALVCRLAPPRSGRDGPRGRRR